MVSQEILERIDGAVLTHVERDVLLVVFLHHFEIQLDHRQIYVENYKEWVLLSLRYLLVILQLGLVNMSPFRGVREFLENVIRFQRVVVVQTEEPLRDLNERLFFELLFALIVVFAKLFLELFQGLLQDLNSDWVLRVHELFLIDER